MVQRSANYFDKLDQCPVLVLNADFQPLSYIPLSLWSWQDAIKVSQHTSGPRAAAAYPHLFSLTSRGAADAHLGRPCLPTEWWWLRTTNMYLPCPLFRASHARADKRSEDVACGHSFTCLYFACFPPP